MKLNPVRYSSAVGESWHHFSFKVKYCHPIFDNKVLREECYQLMLEAFKKYQIRHKDIGFDSNHVHGIIDIGNYSRPEVAKNIKGYVGKKFLERFPEIKEKYFYGSGLWNPAYYMDSIGKDMDFIMGYVRKQRYYAGNQSRLEDYL